MRDEEFIGRAGPGSKPWREIVTTLLIALAALWFTSFLFRSVHGPTLAPDASIWDALSFARSGVVSVVQVLAGVGFGLVGLGMLGRGLFLLFRRGSSETMVNYCVTEAGLRVFRGPETPAWFPAEMHITLPPAVGPGEDFIPWDRMLGVTAGNAPGEAFIWCRAIAERGAATEKPAMTVYPVNGSLRSASKVALIDRLTEILVARGATLEAFAAACAEEAAGKMTLS